MSIDLEQLADRYPDATKELLELTEALKSKELQREGVFNLSMRSIPSFSS